MKSSERHNLHRLFERITPVASVFAVTMGVLVLVGWLFDLDTLKSLLSGSTAMKVNTAVGFILSGISLWGIQTSSQGMLLRIVSRVCAGVVLLLGLLSLGEYLSEMDFGIDQLLIHDATKLPGDIPGRMAVSTAHPDGRGIA
jgi:cation transport ATPase